MGKSEQQCDCEVIHAGVVDEVKNKMPQDVEILRLAEFFKLFGDDTRLKIIWALDKHEMCVCDMAVLLGMTKSAVSHQLRSLREAKLVKTRRAGKIVFYQLSDGHVQEIFEKAVEHVEEK